MKSCYACTWVTEGKKIKHEAIYPQYPGYSLIARPTQKEIFPTLTKLVECLRHLQHPLPAMEENAEACNKRMKQTRFNFFTIFFFWQIVLFIYLGTITPKLFKILFNSFFLLIFSYFIVIFLLAVFLIFDCIFWVYIGMNTTK